MWALIGVHMVSATSSEFGVMSLHCADGRAAKNHKVWQGYRLRHHPRSRLRTYQRGRGLVQMIRWRTICSRRAARDGHRDDLSGRDARQEIQNFFRN
jgi:hypothetical protein